MLRPMWIKAVRDLTTNRFRSLLMLMAMAVGIIGLGFIVDSYTVLTREMDRNYMETDPASFVVKLEKTQELQGAAAALRGMPGIATVEERREVEARVKADRGQWKQARLFIVNDLHRMTLDKAWLEDGTLPHSAAGVLVERAALPVAGVPVGGELTLRLPGAGSTSLKVEGSIHAPGLAPAWMEDVVYVFMDKAVAAGLGVTSGTPQVMVAVARGAMVLGHVRQMAADAQSVLEREGFSVTGVDIPRPGKHPHADQMESLLLLLQAFGILATVLGGVMVANGFASALSGEMKVIGAMKATGGSRRQISTIYMTSALILGCASVLVAMPIAKQMSITYANLAASMLNFRIASYAVPGWAIAAQVVMGLVIPALAAAYPVYSGAQMTVREALSSMGGVPARGSALFASMFRDVTLTRRMSLANMARKPGRLVLTLLTLSVGGASFAVAMNVGASISRTVDGTFQAIRYDASMNLAKPYAADTVRSLAIDKAVESCEAWTTADAEGTGARGNDLGRFRVVGLPADTRLLRLKMVDGRWLRRGGKADEVVINHGLADRTGLGKGDSMAVKLADKRVALRVVGVAREVGAEPAAYINQEAMQTALGQQAKANLLAMRLTRPAARVSLNPSSGGHMAMIRKLLNKGESDVPDGSSIAAGVGVGTALDRLESKLSSNGLEVVGRYQVSQMREAFLAHLKLIVNFIFLMSFLTIAVGGLGLASTMGMSVMERLREIGVMRAIGASKRRIYRIVVGEAMTIAFLSCILAIVISIPLTYVVGNAFAGVFLHTTLDIAIAHHGYLLWLVLAMALAVASSLYPARRAISTPVSEVLSWN